MNQTKRNTHQFFNFEFDFLNFQNFNSPSDEGVSPPLQDFLSPMDVAVVMQLSPLFVLNVPVGGKIIED